MQLFDNEKSKILKEFAKIDKYFNSFKREYISALNSLILTYYPYFKSNTTFTESLNAYSSQLISIADNVIDKDNNYPEYRLEEEKKTMHNLLLKTTKPMVNSKFADELSKTSKKIIVKYFPKIYNLSGNGFRLLETNVALFIQNMLFDFTEQINTDSKA